MKWPAWKGLKLGSVHRSLKIRTDGSHAQVHKLASIRVFEFLLHFCEKWSVCYKIWYTWCHRQREHFKRLLAFITSSPWAVTLSWRKPKGRLGWELLSGRMSQRVFRGKCPSEGRGVGISGGHGWLTYTHRQRAFWPVKPLAQPAIWAKTMIGYQLLVGL